MPKVPYIPQAGMSVVEMDGESYSVHPVIAALLQAVSEERDDMWHALKWCSQRPAFAIGTKARRGWLKHCAKLLSRRG